MNTMHYDILDVEFCCVLLQILLKMTQVNNYKERFIEKQNKKKRTSNFRMYEIEAKVAFIE